VAPDAGPPDVAPDVAPDAGPPDLAVTPPDVAPDLAPDAAVDADPTLLWSGEDPTHLAIDLGASPQLYWTSPLAGTVRRMNLDGSGQALVAAGQPHPTFIAADATSVYWVNTSDQVMAAPLGTSAAAPLFPVHGPVGLLADGVYVFAASAADGIVWRYQPGQNPSPYVSLPAGHKAGALGTGQSNIYYTDVTSGTITRRAKNGSTEIPLVAGVQPAGLVANDNILYWTSETSNDVHSIHNTGTAQPMLIASGELGAAGVTYDGLYVYWADGTSGRLARADQATGATVKAIGSAQHPWGIAVYGGYLYWCDRGAGNGTGSVHRQPLPP
jgi:hypothetical protein